MMSTARRAVRGAGSRAARGAGPLLITAGVLAFAALAFAAWSGWSWLSAPRPLPAAGSRDAALRSGEQAILNFNTLDYRHVTAGLNLWEQSSTGALHAEVLAGRPVFERQIRQAQTVTTARILDGALTALNLRAGTASIIVAIQITVTPPHGAAAVKLSRLAGSLTRTAAGWKLSALGQVPVGASQVPGG